MTPEEPKQRAVKACHAVQANGGTIMRGGYGVYWDRSGQPKPVLGVTHITRFCAIGAVVIHENVSTNCRSTGNATHSTVAAALGLTKDQVIVFTQGFDDRIFHTCGDCSCDPDSSGRTCDCLEWYLAGSSCAEDVFESRS